MWYWMAEPEASGVSMGPIPLAKPDELGAAGLPVVS